MLEHPYEQLSTGQWRYDRVEFVAHTAEGVDALMCAFSWVGSGKPAGSLRDVLGAIAYGQTARGTAYATLTGLYADSDLAQRACALPDVNVRAIDCCFDTLISAPDLPMAWEQLFSALSASCTSQIGDNCGISTWYFGLPRRSNRRFTRVYRWHCSEHGIQALRVEHCARGVRRSEREELLGCVRGGAFPALALGRSASRVEALVAEHGIEIPARARVLGSRVLARSTVSRVVAYHLRRCLRSLEHVCLVDERAEEACDIILSLLRQAENHSVPFASEVE